MRAKTVTARRELVEQILAPQLHTLVHTNRITGKQTRLALVAVPAGSGGGYLRACYAEALFDLFDNNNLLVVRKPEPDQVYDEGAEVDVEVDADAMSTAPRPGFDYTKIRRLTDDDLEGKPRPASPIERDSSPITGQLEDIAPSLVRDEPADDDPKAHLGRGAAGMRATLDAAKAAEAAKDLSAPAKARRVIHHLAVLLRRMSCSVYVIDNGDSQPDKTPTKVTMHIDLPPRGESTP